LRRGISHHVSGHYPAFIATTSSCANPNPSRRLGITFGQRVFAGRCQPRQGVGPSRRSLCESFSACLDPYLGCSCGAHTRFFPQDIGLSDVRTRSAPSHIHTATSVWACFRGCSHSLMFRPADLLATPIAPTAVLTHWAAVASTSEPITVRYLPVPRPDRLTVRFGQLTVRGLSPLKIRSLVGCSPLTVGASGNRGPPHRPGRAVFPHPVPRLYSLSRRTK
jgi:hypothetical protein